MTDRRDGTWHHIAFPEPAYDIGDEPNAEFETSSYRFRYQSMVTPATVYDYDVRARRLVQLKQQEVLGGYDPTRYRAERVHATAPDGTKIPISLVRPIDAPLGFSLNVNLAAWPEEVARVSRDFEVAALPAPARKPA